jgi:hypothetical protein
MMATTHALVGLAVAAGAATVVPEITTPAILAAAAGGVFPDLDLYAGHRQTLHYPVYFGMLAVPAVLVALLVGSALAWVGALFLIGAALHSIMDAAGGGLELRPWRGTSDRAVYSHYHGRWIAPRRWIRYDGAPEDLALGAVAALPGVLTFDGHLATGLLALVAISAGYALVRKPMVSAAEWLLERVPAGLQERLPDRFLEESVGGDTKP